jgi:hypothetical protein
MAARPHKKTFCIYFFMTQTVSGTIGMHRL